jgi:hypothetical protein
MPRRPFPVVLYLRGEETPAENFLDVPRVALAERQWAFSYAAITSEDTRPRSLTW